MTPESPRILIVTARFYDAIADELEAGARETLEEAGARVDTLNVPGAFEVPAAIAAASNRHAGYDGYVALGCVIRGETTHYDYVCTECSRAIMDMTLNKGLAIGFGVLTVENEDQAWARAKRDKKNKGRDAARACLAMIPIQNGAAFAPR